MQEEPFADEVNDLESFVFDNPQLLGEGIESVARQVYTDDGRLDIMAVDRSQGRLVIVELKNVPAGVDVLLQALRYASWAKVNQDSVRLFLQRHDVAEADVKFDSIRIIVVAPEILGNLVELSQYVVDAFEFNFVEIRRFKDKGDSFVVVNQLPTPGAPPGASPPEGWTWDNYRERLGWSSQQVELGKALFNNVRGKIQSKGWPLKPLFRNSYIPFKSGRWNVVGLSSLGTGDGFHLWFRLPGPPEELSIDVPQDLQGSWHDNHYYVKITDTSFDSDRLDELFEASYKYVVGA